MAVLLFILYFDLIKKYYLILSKSETDNIGTSVGLINIINYLNNKYYIVCDNITTLKETFIKNYKNNTHAIYFYELYKEIDSDCHILLDHIYLNIIIVRNELLKIKLIKLLYEIYNREKTGNTTTTNLTEMVDELDNMVNIMSHLNNIHNQSKFNMAKRNRRKK